MAAGTPPRRPDRREHAGQGLSWVPLPLPEEDAINYLHTAVLAYAAKIMAAVDRPSVCVLCRAGKDSDAIRAK